MMFWKICWATGLRGQVAGFKLEYEKRSSHRIVLVIMVAKMSVMRFVANRVSLRKLRSMAELLLARWAMSPDCGEWVVGLGGGNWGGLTGNSPFMFRVLLRLDKGDRIAGITRRYRGGPLADDSEPMSPSLIDCVRVSIKTKKKSTALHLVVTRVASVGYKLYIATSFFKLKTACRFQASSLCIRRPTCLFGLNSLLFFIVI